jgi:hypothetical protein
MSPKPFNTGAAWAAERDAGARNLLIALFDNPVHSARQRFSSSVIVVRRSTRRPLSIRFCGVSSLHRSAVLIVVPFGASPLYLFF